MDLETLASKVAPLVGEHGLMFVDSGLVSARANLQDMGISLLRHAPRTTESTTAPSFGCPRSRWQRSNSHFVAVIIISVWEKYGPISHPLVLADYLMRVFERQVVGGLLQNSRHLFLISSWVVHVEPFSVSLCLHWPISLARYGSFYTYIDMMLTFWCLH